MSVMADSTDLITWNINLIINYGPTWHINELNRKESKLVLIVSRKK